MSVMKMTVFCILLFSTAIFSQFRKSCLIESFSNSACGYCPDENIRVLTIMKKHFGPVIRVRYQVDWPSTSDPMNRFAKADVQNRVNYYRIDGTPSTIFDGVRRSLSHARIVKKQGYIAPVKIDVRTNSIMENNIFSGDVVITAKETLSGSHVLHIAVVERIILYSVAPGSNGDTEFHDILRNFTTGTGQNIGNINLGSSLPYEFSWTIDGTKVKKEQVAVVAWVQDASTKAVINAGVSIPTYFIDAQIGEELNNIKNGYTHYIKCAIKNDNLTNVTTKITIRDTTKSGMYADTRLGWIASETESEKCVLTDSIVTIIDSGDSLHFWTVITAPDAIGEKTTLEVLAENRSNPQTLGWGCVQYFNVRTTISGREYTKPTVTKIFSSQPSRISIPTIMVRENIFSYSLSENGYASIKLYALNGVVATSLYSGVQLQGTYTVNLRDIQLNEGMYIARCFINGNVINRIITYIRN